LKIALTVEDHIGGVLHLHEAPVVAGPEVAQYRAEALRPLIEALL
jgi:hypothetical protein